MTNDLVGVYVHFPFCRRKCAYCAFTSVTDYSLEDDYLYSLETEIGEKIGKTAADTLYFGGGTPSSMKSGALTRIRRALDSKFDFSLREFTVEANPDTVTAEFLRECREIGVNRLSLGLQSADNRVLERIGRLHDVNGFISAVERAKSVGITDISGDLVLGLPGQAESDCIDAAEIFDRLNLDHVSVYALTVEEGTPLERSGYKTDDDKQADYYALAASQLTNRGYHRYEVSNFARHGKTAKHNTKYWTGADYYGFGVSAHSKIGEGRRENTDSLKEYIAGHTLKREYPLTTEDKRTEYIMLRMRLADGIDLAEYERLFGSSLIADRASAVKKLLAAHCIEITDGRLRATDNGFYLLNSIVVELL